MVEENVDLTLADELEGMEGVWEDAKSVRPKNQPIGTFQATITNATLGRSQTSDRLQIHWELTILGGESKDVVLHKYDGLETPEQTAMTQRGLKNLGIEAAKYKLAQLPALLVSLKGKKITVLTRQNGEYYNIYFKRPVKAVTPGAAGSRPAGVPGGPSKF